MRRKILVVLGAQPVAGVEDRAAERAGPREVEGHPVLEELELLGTPRRTEHQPAVARDGDGGRDLERLPVPVRAQRLQAVGPELSHDVCGGAVGARIAGLAAGQAVARQILDVAEQCLGVDALGDHRAG